MLDSVRLQIVLILTQDSCTVCAKRTAGSAIILDAPESRLKCKLNSDRSKIVLILTQDRCKVCVERTIGSEIILDTPDGTPT
jgi:hypothetical protein